MLKLAIAGSGRMGQRIMMLANGDDRFDVVAMLDATGHPHIGRDAGELSGLGHVGLPVQDRTETAFDVLIDFSLPEGTIHWLEYCQAKKRAIVIGTTGHSPEQLDIIEAAAADIPLLKAGNMSVGMNLVFSLVGQIARSLGDAYDIEIVETHHRFKADAPSGTAVTIRDEILKATGREADSDVVYGRQGQTGQRPAKQIGMHALRLGDTVGEHEIHFGSLGETVVLKHSAHTRDTFAGGALRAAAWLKGKPAGRYDMHNVLGL